MLLKPKRLIEGRSTLCCMSASGIQPVAPAKAGFRMAACWSTASRQAGPRNSGTEEIARRSRAPRAVEALAEDIPLSVLTKTTSVVATINPAVMVVHVGAGVHSGTVVNALLHRFPGAFEVSAAICARYVHRLDRFTSGVLLVAKTDAAAGYRSGIFIAQGGEGLPGTGRGHIDGRRAHR